MIQENEDYTKLDESGLFPGHEYFWILAVAPVSRRPVILGPYQSEDEANRVGLEKVDGPFEVVPLSTRDTSKATKILKYRRFHKTAQLDEALKRAHHERGLAHMKKEEL
jgi:hypothetical protein